MRVLITGATGKVGSRLSKRLALRGDRVRALVRDPQRAVGLRDHHVEVVQGDLLDPSSLAAAVHGMDAIVHCAASYFHWATFEQGHAVNDIGSKRLAELASAARVRRFVFISTGLVYGGQGGRFANEDSVCTPSPGLFAGKLTVERALLAMDDLDVRILRFAFVYGDGDPHIDEVVPRMRAALHRRTPTRLARHLLPPICYSSRKITSNGGANEKQEERGSLGYWRVSARGQ